MRRIRPTATAFDFKSLVNVRLHNEHDVYTVHESVLRRTSDFLNAALKEEWDALREEEDKRTVDLSDKNPAIVKIYLHWIYARTFPIHEDLGSPANNLRRILVLLAHCYVLGESLMDESFKTAAMDTYCELMDLYGDNIMKDAVLTHVTPVCTIYGGTPTGSAFRKHLVAYWLTATGGHWAGSVEKIDGLPTEFVADFAEGVRQIKAWGREESMSWDAGLRRYITDELGLHLDRCR